MLKLKDLQNRVYSGKQCTSFEYIVVDPEQHTELFFVRWTKSEAAEDEQWWMRVVLDRTRDADSQVYNFGYVMPRSGLPLELIAATGLKYFQLYLADEIQRKNNYNFVLGDLLQGM